MDKSQLAPLTAADTSWWGDLWATELWRLSRKRNAMLAVVIYSDRQLRDGGSCNIISPNDREINMDESVCMESFCSDSTE